MDWPLITSLEATPRNAEYQSTEQVRDTIRKHRFNLWQLAETPWDSTKSESQNALLPADGAKSER